MTTLLPGDLAIVAARRQDDAEHLLSIVALDAAQGRDVLMCVLDHRWTTIQFLSILSGLSPADVARPDTEEKTAAGLAASNRLRALPIQMTASATYTSGLEDVARWLKEHPSGLAVLVSAWPASLGNDEDGSAAFVRELKMIARSTDGAIIIPWRVTDRGRADPRPMLRDLAVSGTVEDDADQIVWFYESKYGREVYMAKNRHSETGYIFDSRDFGSIN